MIKIYLAFIFFVSFFSLTAFADEVLPAVSAEEMSSYKGAFGKAIAESKRESEGKDKRENFGASVSEAARNSKEEILKTEKNFGSWVSGQRRSDKAETKREGRDESPGVSARGSSPGGRPAGSQKPESAGKPNHGGGAGQGHGKGKP